MAELLSSFKLLIVFGLCYIHSSAQVPGNFSIPDRFSYGCRTPNNEKGKCISILKCKPIKNYIRQLRNKGTNAEINKSLQPYICGQAKSTAKICCPPSSLSIPVVSQIPDVSLEDKLKLLPMDDCGITPNLDRFPQGANAVLFEFPWMAALMFRSVNGPVFQCGGTLINKRYILTAAHCLKSANKNKKRELVQIRLGEHDFDTDEDCDIHPFGKMCAPPVQNFDVSFKDAIIHPKYNPVTLDDDIALIRLPRDADLSGFSVKPVCLPVSNIRKKTTFKRKLTVSGWGKTEEGAYSPYLLKAFVPAVDNDKCSELYKGPILITEKQLCTGGENSQHTCTGVSGGPLTDLVVEGYVLRTVQYGIVSAGPYQCEKKDFPVRYTRVTSYTDWILENIRP